MVLEAAEPHPDKPGVVRRERITWTPQPDGGVHQWWQRSDDEGRTWSTVFDGRYVRSR
jgi:hypothetical protein